MSKWVGFVCIVATCILTSSFAAAHEGNSSNNNTTSTNSNNNNERYRYFTNDLWTFAEEQARRGNKLPGMVAHLSEVWSDLLVQEANQDGVRGVLHREDEISRILDLLQRKKNKFPIVVGDTGVGKTDVIKETVLRIAFREFPPSDLYKNTFRGMVVFRTSMRRFIPGGADISAYLDTVKFIQENLNRKILVVFQESHFANDYIVSVLREEADSDNPLPIILEVDSKSYGNSIKGHPSFTSIAEPVMIREFRPDQVKDIIGELIKDELTPRTNVRITEDVLNALIDVSPDYRKDVAEPRRSEKLIEDFMVHQNRKAKGKAVTPKRADLFRFVASQLGLPVIPQNEQEFANYMQGVKERMKERIIGQKAMVDGVVDQFIAALTSRSRQHNIALLMGPTGVGKSLLGEILAEEFYGDKSRLIELDMTQYKDAHTMTSLFGANNGYVSSDKEKGVLCDFFDGRGKGGGIVIMNEIEEMSADALTRFMEMWDKGSFPGGDGKLRYVGRTLFILTSNKNSDRILSYDAIKGMTRAELDRRIAGITEEQLKKAFTEKASYTEDASKQVKSAILERVDRIYFASPLLKDEAVQIAHLEINKFVRDYHKQSDTRIVVDDSLAEVMTSAFYNEALGARQIRTNVQQYLSRAINEFKLQHGFKSKELKISAKLHKSLKTVSYVTITDGKNELTIDGPRIPVKNKLLDAEFRQRLVDLEANMKSEIFGQDEAIRAIASGVKARFLEGEEGRPVAGFLLGVTGSGKSELAKVLAKHLFGRKEAIRLFDMGRIQHESDLNTILSPGKGIIGSDQPGELEQFLIQYPDGGVLLFDEMSNVGGNNIVFKRSVAMQFYTMLEEGFYRSPSGKVYPLNNHVMIFTGNDGEEILRGLTSDSMLEETYNDVMKDPQFVKNLLSQAGFTDAFIGRLAFSHFMRPTLGDVKTLIAKKLINEWKQKVEKNQPIDIELPEDIYKEIGALMFSPKTGARSINEFVKNTLGPLVTDQALTHSWDALLEEGTRLKIKVRLHTIKPTNPFYSGSKPDPRKAVIHAETYMGEEKVGESKADFTDKASFIPQVHIDNAMATAYHEMGHAITAFTKVTGKKVVKITIVPESFGGDFSALGYVQYRNVPRQGPPDWEWMVKHIAGLLAGSEAETLFVGKDNAHNVGRSNDVERAGSLARRMILDAHLMPELDAAHAYKDSKGDIVTNLPADLQAKFDRLVQKAIDEARDLAVSHIKANWGLIEAGVKFLMEMGGTMNAKEFSVLEKEWAEAVKEGKQTLDIEPAAIRAKACEAALMN